MRRLPVTPAMAKRELRLRAMFHKAESNPRLAKYMRKSKTSLLTALSGWSTCAIVDALNARFVLNSTVGTDTFESDIPGELATRVCAIIGEGEGSAEEIPGGWSVTVEDLPSDNNWPVDQKRLAGMCKTGFLYLGSDIVATTLHGGYTDNLLCVFDFKLGDGASEAPTFYSNSQVRRVDSVLAYGVDDWSLLRLSEPIAREPLQPSDVELHNGDHVFAIGHPYGLPLKFVGVNDVVCNVEEQPDGCPYFTSDLVMYPYNSGSPVFLTDGSLVGLYAYHFGDTLIEYSSSETCYLLEGLSGCDEDEEADLSDCCVANYCGTAGAVRITEVRNDAEEEEPEVVVIVNNASNTAYLQMSDALESIIQLEPNEELRKPLHETSAVWLLSCGARDADWKCELLRFRVKRGQRWRIMDEQSPDSDIQPGTRKVMERVEPK